MNCLFYRHCIISNNLKNLVAIWSWVMRIKFNAIFFCVRTNLYFISGTFHALAGHLLTKSVTVPPTTGRLASLTIANIIILT